MKMNMLSSQTISISDSLLDIISAPSTTALQVCLDINEKLFGVLIP